MTFPTDNKDIQLTMDVYKGVRGVNRKAIRLNASIHYENNRLILSVNLSRHEDQRAEMWLLLGKEIDDITIRKATLDRKDIRLRINNQKVKFTSAGSEKEGCIMRAELKEVSYFGNNADINRFRLSATANDLQGYINALDEHCQRLEMHPREIAYHGKKYVLMHDGYRVWIETIENNIDELLSLISFYYATPVECDIDVVNGKTTIRKTEWNLGEGKWKNNALSQLYTEDESYDWFWTYIKLVDNEHPINKKTALYIREFIRSQLLDEVSKLQNYCAILENAANVNICEDSYAKIKDYLKTYHVVAKKIDGDLTNKRIKKNQTDIVTDFYDLRSFFVHRLGSEEARKYLKDSQLLERLEFAINIVILRQLGAEDVRFDSMFKSQSVFDDSVPYGYVYERLLEGL